MFYSSMSLSPETGKGDAARAVFLEATEPADAALCPPVLRSGECPPAPTEPRALSLRLVCGSHRTRDPPGCV